MDVEIRSSRNRDELARFFLQHPAAHIYALADLEDPFWSHVDAFVAEDDGNIVAAAFLFDMLKTPVLYCIARPGDERAALLLKTIAAEVPSPCFGHLGIGLAAAVGREFESFGTVIKMQLTQPAAPKEARDIVPVLLDSQHTQELSTFYEENAYTDGDLGGGFFEPFMLDTGPYFGIREAGRLVAAGGVHVRSADYGVAALGNVAAAPEYRGRGFGTAITWAICDRLQQQTKTIGLNVHSQNTTAQRCYQRLGFERVFEYEEVMFA